MSKYADKRRSTAPCAAVVDCPDAGTVLRLVNGSPEWICERHLELVDERIRRGMP